MPETLLNETPRHTIKALCICRGRGCVMCEHTGYIEKKACGRCGGTGTETKVRGIGGKCFDCRGDGWRDIDNVKSWD